MVKRAPSEPRVDALPLSWQAAPLPPGPPSPTGRPRRPPSLETPAGKMRLLGPPRGPGLQRRAARRLGGSGAPAPGPRFSTGAARISCRGSRAPGAAPSDRTTRARGRGRQRRRAFEVLGAPAGSPRRGSALVAPGLQEGGFPAPTLAAGTGPWRPQQLRQCQEQGRFIFLIRARLTLPPSLFIFSSLA